MDSVIWASFIIRHSSFDIRHLAAIFRVPMNLLINLCLALFVLCSLLMVLVILMQRPKSEGLGAAFGGAVTENIFGAQTTNVLVKFTTWLAGIFFGLTLVLSILYAHRSTADSAFRRELMKTQSAPQASPAPTAAGASPVTAPVRTSPAASEAPASNAVASPVGSVAPAASPAATGKP
ncbi:MAG TPA: preprotein translocase subunit SecG [Candidatus Udaeobacter sp.]|nr:preprotein translocase subunit SecG [Candidatus Udaeobacter sp.]